MKTCEDCSYCIQLGQGDYLCEQTMDLVILSDKPTEDYNKCEKESKKHESI